MKNIPSVSDSSMWDIWMSMYHLAVISVADELNLFEKIGTRNCKVETIAKSLHISIRSVEILLQVLAGLGFIRKQKNNFALTKFAETYLLPKSPYYWGPIPIY